MACAPRWPTRQIADPADVHFVQIKCPLLTAQRIADAEARGQTVSTRDTLKSMGLSRAASALGVAVALGEIDARAFRDAEIGADRSFWSGRASASAGIELMGHEIVVLGMSAAVERSACHRSRGDGGRDRYRAGAGRAGASRARAAGQMPPPSATASSPSSRKPRRATTAGCAAIATPCWTTPIFRRRATRAPSSAARWRASLVTLRSMSPAAPNIRARMAAGRSR